MSDATGDPCRGDIIQATGSGEQIVSRIEICRPDGVYTAGRVIRIDWSASPLRAARGHQTRRRLPIQNVELSVMWSTIGKGDIDYSIHHFARFDGSAGSTRCCLPRTPLSYEGQLISIRWGIRLRIQTDDGGTVTHETPIDLFAPEVDRSSVSSRDRSGKMTSSRSRGRRAAHPNRP